MTPRNDDPSERERPSWREIDQRRDGSRHVSRGERPAARPGSPQAERLRQRALQAANKVFQGKQGTPAHQKLADALHRHFGGKKFTPLVKAYVKEYGLPRDWGLLFLFLDFPDPSISTGSLEQMARLHPTRSPAGAAGLPEQTAHPRPPWPRTRRSRRFLKPCCLPYPDFFIDILFFFSKFRNFA